ncbi:MAG: signal peptide peptidase SppA, partial [Planctomycetales bacterium]|nr:signal peptide peptidase SppA [Planctomycetales bacterium]
RHKSTGLARLFGWLGWLGFFLAGALLLSVLSSQADYYSGDGDATERYHSGEKYSLNKVAIITLEGVIMDGDGFVKQQIDHIRDDENVKAVVLRVNSPGGTVTGSDYIFHHLKRLRKEKDIPIVVSMGSIAASGGYYAAMAVGDQKDSIYAEPTTTTGSIGVIVPHYDVTGLMERYDIADDSIASHPNKQMLSMTRKLSDEQRALVQDYVNESFERFKSIVKEGRPLYQKDPDALEQLATGEVFTADKAKKFGLVDRIGFIEDAIERAAELADLDQKKYRVVDFERPVSALELIGLSARAGRGQASELSALLELNSPRAYFIATTLPPLISSSKAYGSAD